MNHLVNYKFGFPLTALAQIKAIIIHRRRGTSEPRDQCSRAIAYFNLLKNEYNVDDKTDKQGSLFY